MEMTHRALTISMVGDPYQSLHARIGEDDISRFVEDLFRPRFDAAIDLEAEYREQATDEEPEREAREWLEADLGETLG